jgi:DNA polymerase-3 subunit delta
MTYLFYGDDDFKIKKSLDLLVSQKEGAELSIFEADQGDQFLLAVNTKSFFSPDRILVLKNGLGNLKPETEKHLQGSLDQNDNTVIVFVEPKKPKATWVNAISKSGKVTELTKPKNTNLVAYIKEKVKDEGGDIAPLAAERLSTYVGGDLWKLEEEIKKLVLYKQGTEEAIDTADVDLLVKANFEANIFALMDAVAAKNNRRAIELLDSFMESGENEIYVMTMVWRQFRNLAMAKFEENITEQTLAKKAGVHPFVAGKAIRSAKNFTKEEILTIYQKLVETDFALKSGADANNALLRLVI